MSDQENKQNSEQSVRDSRPMRRIRSYVLREGRLTKGQQLAFDEFMPHVGLDPSQPVNDFADVFGRAGEVVLEIGFGMGHSLVEQAAESPERNFVGIEVHKPGVGSCLVAAAQAEVSNIRLYHFDAVEVLKHCIPDASLSRVQIFFPDPWPKQRHQKRRLVQLSLVAQLREKLVAGGILHLATDWEDYAKHMLKVMGRAPGWYNLADDLEQTSDLKPGYVPRPDFRPLTKFEKRGTRLGHGVWDLMYRRSDADNV